MDELVNSYDAALEDMAVLFTTTANDSVRLGAIRGRVDVLEKKVGLLMSAGMLPRDIGQFRVVMEAEQLVEAVVGALDRAEVPLEVYEDVAQQLDRLLGLPTLVASWSRADRALRSRPCGRDRCAPMQATL